MTAQPTCPICGTDRVATRLETDTWDIGDMGGKACATVPVMRCEAKACAFQWTDSRAEDIRALVSRTAIEIMPRIWKKTQPSSEPKVDGK